MDSDLIAARDALVPDVSAASTWMAPPDQRNFIGLGVVEGIALVLVTQFLAGIQEQAKKEAKEAGVSVTKWAADQIRGLFSGKPATPEEKSAEADAGKAAYDKDKADASEQLVLRVLVEMMPVANATNLAHSVRVSVEQHIVPVNP
jgi:hypothetical protein